MAKNQTYRAFVAHPTHILNLDDELLDSAPIMSHLAVEVRGISSYSTYVVRNDTQLDAGLATAGAVQPATAGRRAGVTLPDFLVTGKSGRSRKEALIQHRVVTEYRSWQERVKAANGESDKYISQGWKRTMNAAPPTYGEGDFINLGAVDRKYALIENNPFTDGEIILKMVIRGAWYRLIFPFDNKRFTEGKVTLPVVKVEAGKPVFIFSVATDNPVVQFSSDYTIGVDVGISDYATVVVRNSSTGKITYRTTLSQRVHSLWNSVRASEKQMRQLREKVGHFRCMTVRVVWRLVMRLTYIVRRLPGRNVSLLLLWHRKLLICRISLVMLWLLLKTSAGLRIRCKMGAGIAANWSNGSPIMLVRTTAGLLP